MAVDQWLLETRDKPLLRVYRWRPGWGSFGYFVPLAEAENAMPDRQWVRRWTGGGIVDHAQDWTYTLVVPGRQWLAVMRGGESYRVVHQALASALNEEGQEAILAGSLPGAQGGECFAKPVEHDLCDSSGRKLAGAGQRRSRHGLLHQGSVMLTGSPDPSQGFAGRLAGETEEVRLLPPTSEIEERVKARYGREDWLNRR